MDRSVKNSRVILSLSSKKTITMAKKKVISYWSGTGKYQAVHDVLWDELVPDSGNAETDHGEVVRALGRLWHEYCNNGNCNAAEGVEETCDECDGWGYEEKEVYCGTDDDGEDIYETETDDCSYCDGNCSVETGKELDEYYADMLRHIERVVPNIYNETQAVRNLITGHKNYNYDYTQEEMDVYNRLSDKCLEFLVKDRNLDLEKVKLDAIKVKINDRLGIAKFFRKETIEREAGYEAMLANGLDKNSKEAKEARKRIRHSKNTVKEYEAKAEEHKQDLIKELTKQGKNKKQ